MNMTITSNNPHVIETQITITALITFRNRRLSWPVAATLRTDSAAPTVFAKHANKLLAVSCDICHSNGSTGTLQHTKSQSQILIRSQLTSTKIQIQIKKKKNLKIELNTYWIFICRKSKPRIASEHRRTMNTSESSEMMLEFR